MGWASPFPWLEIRESPEAKKRLLESTEKVPLTYWYVEEPRPKQFGEGSARST
jgi:hypothetical protein